MVRQSGEDGISISGGTGEATVSNITIKGNHSVQNGRDGIVVTLGPCEVCPTVSVTGITDNETNNNGRDGIRVGSGSSPVPGSGATPISANTADRNGGDGINLQNTGYVVLANNAEENTVNGINAVGNINAGGNTAIGNGSCNTPGCF